MIRLFKEEEPTETVLFASVLEFAPSATESAWSALACTPNAMLLSAEAVESFPIAIA